MTDTTARTYRFEAVGYDDPRAVHLRELMDEDMAVRYATRDRDSSVNDEITRVLAVHPSSVLATILVVDDDDAPIGHALLRDLDGEWEVKRVIVAGGHRARGIGRALMTELERLARQGGVRRLILQTGDRQPEAVALYKRLGYTPIPIYEPYVASMPFSLCYEKILG